MVRTRTIKEAAAYFREGDPQTCLTETAIRTLLRSGAVPSAKVEEVPGGCGGPGSLSYGRNRTSRTNPFFSKQPAKSLANSLTNAIYRREEIK